jgi:ClpP class serine protease
MPTREQRVELIRALQDARDGRIVIAYVTATRPDFSAPMGMDAIPRIYRHLRELNLPPRDSAHIDLVLHSDGGDGTMPWRMMTLLREFAATVCLLVPHRAFSAATLAALGANKVIMHPMGMLGPIDPTVNGPFNPSEPADPGQRLGISVEDVAAYISLVKEDVGITHEDELVQAFNLLADKVHPLALGNVKRITSGTSH